MRLLSFALNQIHVQQQPVRPIVFILLAVLLLPLFWLNVKDSHDWGDDFAQYFIQAKNILEHKPQTDNGLVSDQQTGEYALQAYPAGFPLLLAASWKMAGGSVFVSSILLSLFLVAFGFISFFYFRKYFNVTAAMLITLIIIYNPLTLGFKKEILSDIPFSFFLLAGILLFQAEKKTIRHHLLTGIVWGFALSVRGMGGVLFVGGVFFLLYEMVLLGMKRRTRDDFLASLKKIMTVILSALGFYLLLNAVLIPVPSGGILGFYAEAVKGENVGRWMLLNLEYYYEVFLNFFSTMGGRFMFVSTATKFILLALLPVGIFFSWKKKMAFDDFVLTGYLIVLFIYPYLGGGFRFLLPVFPILLKYIFTGLEAILKSARLSSRFPEIIFLVIILLQYMPGVSDQVSTMDLAEQGPQEKQAVEAFTYIHEKLPADAVVVFIKPRALSFYSGRKAAYVMRNVAADELNAIFRRMNAHFFLLCRENEEVKDVVLEKFISENKDEVRSIWNNEYFNLYSDLKP